MGLIIYLICMVLYFLLGVQFERLNNQDDVDLLTIIVYLILSLLLPFGVLMFFFHFNSSSCYFGRQKIFNAISRVMLYKVF